MVVDFAGKPVAAGEKGFLVIQRPWPSMIRTILNDPKRYEDQYWRRVTGRLLHGRRRAARRGRLLLDSGPCR